MVAERREPSGFRLARSEPGYRRACTLPLTWPEKFKTLSVVAPFDSKLARIDIAVTNGNATVLRPKKTGTPVQGRLEMHRLKFFLIAVCVILAAAGCRNRCGNTCGSGLFARSSTIGAPPTYSLNIPSMANNQPYYVPGQQPLAGGGALNTQAAAPTLDRTATSTNLNGWRAVEPNSGASNNAGGALPTGTGATTFAQSNPAVPAGYRWASSTALPGSGSSFVDSTNYQSTRRDETRDQTRLPAIDASNVRAPAQNNPTGNPTRFAQLPTATQPYYPPTFNRTASTGSPVYSGSPMIGNPAYANAPTYPVYATQPIIGGQRYQTPFIASAPVVLGQSTTTYNANSVGWRDREVGSDIR